MKELYPMAVVVAAMAVGVLSVEIPTECPPAGSDPVSGAVHIAHESDCTKFYKCFMGEKYEMDCALDANGDRLYFNPETQVCDWRWNVTCRNKPDSECISNPDGFIWPYPFDCSSYYRCDKGKKHLTRCDKGLLFDPEQLSCKPEMDVNCDTLANNYECSSQTEGVRFPHECICFEYYKCSNGELSLNECNSGELFDHKFRKCVPSEKAVCNPTTPSKTVCPPIGTVRLPHEKNCSLFYNCMDGVKTIQECIAGLYFNDIMGMCAWGEDVDCGSRFRTEISPIEDVTDTIVKTICPTKESNEIVRLPHPCICSVYYLCVNGTPYRKPCPKDQEFDYVNQVCDNPKKVHCVRPIPPLPTPKSTQSPSSTTANVPIKKQCPSWGTVKIPCEYDCSRYYECKNGVREEAKCLEGHYFNELLQVCDLPRNTNCSPTHGNECPISDYPILLPDQESCSHYYRCINGYKTRTSCPSGFLYNVDKQMCDLPQYVNCS